MDSKTCILVSGFGAPGLEWGLSPLKHLLHFHDWDVHVFRSGVGHPDDRAKRLADFVNDLEGPVSAVGHSMGGVICEALDVLTGKLDKVVTLGTPHGGVPLLRLLPFNLGGLRELRENSAYLKELRAGAHSAEYLCIAGGHDPVVTRESAWSIKHALTALVPSGHAELFARKDVARLAGQFFGLVGG